MRLHEEYISRHDLAIPVVRYDRRSTVFLKSKDAPYQWRILSLTWNECHWHPGHFEVRYTRPNHDGYLNCLIEDVFGPRNVYWDDYEGHVLELIGEAREDYQAVPFEERCLAAWYMFLFMYDSALVMAGPEFLSVAGKILTPDLSLSRKMSLIERGKLQLEQCNSGVYEALLHQVMPMTMNYAEWLVKLFNG